MKKQYALIDILKYIASILIILLHAQAVTKAHIDPYSIKGAIGSILLIFFCRLPVPFFFTVSGYFLFKKVRSAEAPGKVIIGFCKRILILYAFWFVLNILYIIRIKFGFHMPGIKKIVFFIKDIFLQGTFSASWYLMASVIDAVIVYFLTRITKNNYFALGVAIAAYIVCMLCSNYGFIVDELGGGIKAVFSVCSRYYGKIYLSFPYGLIFFVIGKILAEKEEETDRSGVWVKTIIAAILYIAEFFVVIYVLKRRAVSYAAFASYPILMYFFISACLKSNIKYKDIYRGGRKASTIIYCSHYSIAWVSAKLLKKYFEMPNLAEAAIVFVITFIICMCLSYLIIKLSSRWKILSYLY